MSNLNVLILISSITSMLILIFLSNEILLKNNSLTNKQAFECGFMSKPNPSNTFSINYFFITIVFLMFDLEVVFICPFLIFNSSLSSSLMLLTLVAYFSLVLTLEWFNSMLEWEK